MILYLSPDLFLPVEAHSFVSPLLPLPVPHPGVALGDVGFSFTICEQYMPFLWQESELEV